MKIVGQRGMKSFGGRLLAAAFLATAWLGSSGCTVLLAAAGAVVDTSVITSPLWGPGMYNRTKLEKVQKDVALPGNDGVTVATELSDLTEPDSPILIRPLEGPKQDKGDDTHYYRWLGMVPFVPYSSRSVPVWKAQSGKIPAEFAGSTGGEAKQIRFPLSRFPEAIRPSEETGVVGQSRDAAEAILRGELVSFPPTERELTVAYYNSLCSSKSVLVFSGPETAELAKGDPQALCDVLHTKTPYLYGVTLFTQDSLQKALPTFRVALQVPRASGYFELDQSAANPSVQPTRAIGYGIVGDDCIVTVPPTAYRLVGRTDGYPTPAPSQIVVSGQIRSFRLEVSNISYCLTYIGADLLSFLGLPLSSSRLVMELDLRAHRGGDYTPVLERSYTLETERRTTSLYYGGDYAKELNVELMEQASIAIAQFAVDLQPLVTSSGPVAARNDSGAVADAETVANPR